MNKIFKYVISFALTASLVGCIDKFDGMNTNPYEPSTLPVTSFFPEMIDCLASPEENPCQRNNSFWASFGGYVVASNDWGRSNLFETFNIDDNWNKWSQNWYFEQFYPAWFNVQRFTNGEGYYYQMAQLLRVFVMQHMASMQGPVPYTKVANGEFYVAYDDEQTLWRALFDDLDAAIAEIQGAAASGSTPLSAVDRVYGGDNNLWLKFANTLKLRMAMRISNVDAEFAKQKAEEAVAAGVMTSAGDSAYDKLNGRYRNGFYQLDKAWGGEVKANACITAYMNGYNDPRREKYFLPATNGEFVGARAGLAMDKSNYTGYSSMIYGQDAMMTEKMPIMLASEAAFLRAEGALKGWSMGGDAKTFYEEGIKLSFEVWGASGADAYIADATSVPGNHADLTSSWDLTNKSKVTIAWDDAATNEKKLEKIITQKWIAGYPNGLEAWSDFRRTGYPYMFPPVNNRSGGAVDSELGQRRLRFSEDEFNRNSENVQAAVQMLSNKTDADYTDLWWATTTKKY